MKNRYKFLILALVALALTSCEEFLDLKPVSDGIAVENERSDSILYKSAGEAEAALAGVYTDLRNEFFELDYFACGDAQSDDAYAGGDNPNFFQIDDFTIDAGNQVVTRDWNYLYQTIGKANYVINNVNAVTDPELTPQRKKEMIGEALFIRAFVYFNLVRLWGDVPLVLESVNTFNLEILPMLFPPRTPMDQVYAQIIKDLEQALEDVRTAADNKTTITKGAVNTLLAKVYATIEPRDWNKVLQYCTAVENGGYSLLPEYDHLWDNTHENSSEAIWEINYDGTPSSGNWGASMFLGMDWKKWNTPSNDLVKAFDDENDAIRKNASIVFLDVSGKWTDPYWPQSGFPFINKYRIYTNPSPQNYIFFRLADILLLKAEAENELGNLQSAAELVNQIRSRVDLPTTAAGTKEAMRLVIEKERRLELAFEGHRWFDLKRTGRAIEVMNGVTNFGETSKSYSLSEFRLVWPIPQSELDKNQKLVQNTGY